MMRNTYSIVLVDPNTLFREGLSRVLRGGRFRITISAPRYSNALLDQTDTSENLLLIVGPGAMAHGVAQQIRQFKAAFPSGRVVIIADDFQLNEVLSAFKAGVNGYFTQSARCEALLKGLELVMLGETIVPQEIVRHVLDDVANGSSARSQEPSPVVAPAAGTPTPNLSRQEKTILHYLVEGSSNKVIARQMEIAEATVKVHVKAILRKTQMRNRTQAAIWAMHNFSEDVGER